MGFSTLPILQTAGNPPGANDFSLLQSRWSSILNPLLRNPLNGVVILENVALINGVTAINHTLGRTPQGWMVLDVNGSATIYRSQPFDPKILTLTSNAAVTCRIGVF